MAYLLSRENEQELCSFWKFSGIIIRGPNRSEKDRHPCRWDERIIFAKRSILHEERAHNVALSSPVSTVYARNAWVFTSLLPSLLESLAVLGCCLLAAVMKFQGKLASLPQVSTPNSQDNFQICCADMYLVRFLANFAGFRVFLWISRDFADLIEICGSATARNIRSPVYYICTLVHALR